jgi:hypothetical protein
VLLHACPRSNTRGALPCVRRGAAQVHLLAKHTGHSEEKIAKDISRPRYFDPYEAVEYNLIDRVRRGWELGGRGPKGQAGMRGHSSQWAWVLCRLPHTWECSTCKTGTPVLVHPFTFRISRPAHQLARILRGYACIVLYSGVGAGGGGCEAGGACCTGVQLSLSKEDKGCENGGVDSSERSRPRPARLPDGPAAQRSQPASRAFPGPGCRAQAEGPLLSGKLDKLVAPVLVCNLQSNAACAVRRAAARLLLLAIWHSSSGCGLGGHKPNAACGRLVCNELFRVGNEWRPHMAATQWPKQLSWTSDLSTLCISMLGSANGFTYLDRCYKSLVK